MIKLKVVSTSNIITNLLVNLQYKLEPLVNKDRYWQEVTELLLEDSFYCGKKLWDEPDKPMELEKITKKSNKTRKPKSVK